MWTRILDIDFAAKSIALEVAPDRTDDFFACLDEYVAKCQSQGFADVHLLYARGTSRPMVRRLLEFAEMKRIAKPKLSPGDGGPSGRGQFHSELHVDPTSPSLEPALKYHITFDDMNVAVDYVSRSVTLISGSVSLSPRQQLQLRLSLYELAANTVDHGKFETQRATIRIKLFLTKDYCLAEYQDNADAFSPRIQPGDDAVAKQIDARSKRGLGLFMLNKICDEITYERTSEWNTTRLQLNWRKSPVAGQKE